MFKTDISSQQEDPSQQEYSSEGDQSVGDPEDPYIWLEGDDLEGDDLEGENSVVESQEVREWDKLQNDLADEYLTAWLERDRIKTILSAALDSESSLPVFRRNYIFHTGYLPGDEKLCLLITERSEKLETGAARVLINPNDLEPNSEIDWFYPSPDGKFTAFGLSTHGNEQSVLYVIDTESGEVLPDAVEHTSFAQVAWLPDSSGFYYSGGKASDFEDEEKYIFFYDAAGQKTLSPKAAGQKSLSPKSLNQKSLSQQAEKLSPSAGIGSSTIQRKEEELRLHDPFITPQLSESGRYLIVNKSWEKPTAAYYKDRKAGTSAWHPFLLDIDGESYGVFRGENYFVLTTWGAPKGRIISIPMETAADRSTWKEIVEESDAVIRHFTFAGDVMVLSELVDAHSRIRSISLEDGDTYVCRLPGYGLIESEAPSSSPFSVDGSAFDSGDPEKTAGGTVYFIYTTFTEPSRLYSFNVESRELKALGDDPELDLSHIETKMELYTAYDGSRVPIFLICKKDQVVQTASASEGAGDEAFTTAPGNVLLHAYGGWNINLAPSYIGTGRTSVLPFVEAGGVYAYAAIRGGCELGRQWWLQGRREHKQNSFDDFYAAAEYLIQKGITTEKQLAVMGASNGGLLTAAAVTQRPELFAAAVVEVPLTDMFRALRGPYVSSYTEEYGSPDDPDMRDVLLKYSPVHNIRKGTAYPAVFILSGLSDIRCQTWNGRKFAAGLQYAAAPASAETRNTEKNHEAKQIRETHEPEEPNEPNESNESNEAPILFKAVSGGHGPGLSRKEKIDRRTDILTFVMKYFGMHLSEELEQTYMQVYHRTHPSYASSSEKCGKKVR